MRCIMNMTAKILKTVSSLIVGASIFLCPLSVLAAGYASLSQGVSISPETVILGQDFSVSFTLKEVRGEAKTFENVAVAIHQADNSFLFDFAMYDNVTIPAYGTWSETATNHLYADKPPGTYKVVVKGRVGGEWFDFDTVDNGVNPRTFTAVSPEGYASVSGGLTVSPSTVYLDQDFTISFTLKEVRGASKTFDHVAIAILDSSNNFVFDFVMYDNVTISAYGTWGRSPTNYIYADRLPGTYKAVVRGNVGGEWFDFDTTGSGVNPRAFTVVKPEGYASVSEGINISPPPVVIDQDFEVSFTLKEVRGASKTFEQIAVAIHDANNSFLFDFATYDNVTIPAYGTWSETATNHLYADRPPGTYNVLIKGKVGGEWFDFDTVDGGVNPKEFIAVKEEGYASVSEGINISHTPVIIDQYFEISFTIKEIRGNSKTFDQIAIAILDSDGNSLFDFAMFYNVMISAYGTWSESATNKIYPDKPPGTYKAVIRGKVDGEWFDFDTTGNGVNPVEFNVARSEDYAVPTIAQWPMEGAPGTEFEQWGTGFTPGSTVTLHFQTPEGTESGTLRVSTDAGGGFNVTYPSSLNKPPGVYTWWAVDNATGEKCIALKYTITQSTVSAIARVTAYDSVSGNSVQNAAVTLGSAVEETNSAGSATFSDVSSGEHELEITADGYLAYHTTISLPEKGTTLLRYGLIPTSVITGDKLVVTDVKSYPSNRNRPAFFLDGVDFHVGFSADVHWNGKTPGKVRFITPKDSHDETSAGHIFNMGQDFGAGGRLTVVAVSQDGTESDPFDANIEVMPLPREKRIFDEAVGGR